MVLDYVTKRKGILRRSWGDVSEGLLLFAAECEQLPGFDSNER